MSDPAGRAPLRPGPQRGYIDNRPVLWILIVLGIVAYVEYHRMRTGEGPWELLGQVSPILWWFLAALAAVASAGVLAAIVLGGNASRRELRSFPAEGATILVLRSTSGQAVAGTLAALGCVSLAFGFVGEGGGWWVALVAGAVLCPAGLGIAGSGRRWVLAKDRVQTESLWYGIRKPLQSWALDAERPPQITLEEHRHGGAFGQPIVEEYRVLLDKRLLHASADRAQAAAFVEATRQAYPEARIADATATPPAS